MNSHSALLVIDMQKGSFTANTPRYDSEEVIKNINNLAEVFRARTLPVMHIQHDGSKENCFVPGSEEWEILDELSIEDKDIVVPKTANDAFYQSQLETLLQDLGVSQLYVTGCATDFCVESTIQSALSRDYKITVLSDGHTTADRPHLPAEKVVSHYNWVWQNMIPTKGKIEVRSSESVCQEMSNTYELI